MPKLVKNTGKITTIRGRAEVIGVPGHWAPGRIDTIITPGYWKSNGGYYASIPAHWEYPYKTVIDPNWAINNNYYGPAVPGQGFTQDDFGNAIYPKYVQVLDYDADPVWVSHVNRYYSNPSTWVPESISYVQQQSTWYPAIPYSPAVPDITTISSVRGWTSWARSIDPIREGAFFNFKVSPGSRGAFCALGVISSVGASISEFAHAIMVNANGVHIYEKGALVQTLKSSYSEVTDMRIIRQSLTSVIYLVVTGGESLIHQSDTSAAITDLYGFGYLYDGGDSLSTSGISNGVIQFGRA